MNNTEQQIMHEELQNYLLSKGFSSLTVGSYQNMIARFQQWLLQQNIPLGMLSYGDVLHYIQGFKKKAAQNTIAGNLNSIKHYCNFLCVKGILLDNPVQHMVIKGVQRKKLYHILSQQELEALYHNFSLVQDQGSDQSRFASSKALYKRNKIILGLLIYQGLNTTELSRLAVDDLKLREGKIYIAQGRKSNARELTLQALQIMDLMEYVLKDRLELLQQAGKESDLLLISAGSGAKLHNALAGLLKSLRQQNSSLESFKQIRTSVITHWLKVHNLRKVQYLAGHKYVSSTESYLINDLEDLLEDINKFHPIG